AWRPNPEIQPPPRRAASTHDRNEDMLPTAADAAKSKSMLGRRLAMGGLGVVLFLGLGSVGFYFRFSAPEPPPTDPYEFLNAYDGGDCFFLTREALSDDPTIRDVDGLGSSVAPFEVLNSEFQRRFGSETTIGLHPVTAEQCPAVNFLFRTRNQGGVAPRLDIVTPSLKEDPPTLRGTVAEFGDRPLELVLVQDIGYVLNLTRFLVPSDGNTMIFSFQIWKNNPGSPKPQLLIAVASPLPLAALNVPQDDAAAERVFTQAL